VSDCLAAILERLTVTFIGIHIINKLLKPDRPKNQYEQTYRTGDGKYRYQHKDNKNQSTFDSGTDGGRYHFSLPYLFY